MRNTGIKTIVTSCLLMQITARDMTILPECTASPIRQIMDTPQTMVTNPMNRVITITMKTVMATTGVSTRGIMIAGSVATVVSISAHMVMKEKENLKGITVDGSIPGS